MLCICSFAEAQKPGDSSRFCFRISAGYAIENFNWSIAGNNENGEPVNILSELRWKNIGGPQLGIHGEAYLWKKLSIRGDFYKTFITTGEVTDTDFSGNDRSDTLFHDTFSSDKGSISGYHGAMGYTFDLAQKHSIKPFVGYGKDSQLLYLLRDYGNVQGDLKSTYHTQWVGVLTGFDLCVSLHPKLTGRGQFMYHQVKYSAAADWNLIADFEHPVSFKHKAKGYGLEAEGALEYLVRKRVTIVLITRYRYWTTGPGTDTLFRIGGNTIVTKLNPVHRNSLIFSTGVHVKF
ncbi:MAG TPA: hypothetical protein VGK59_00105 [Ohtaekwangia sp.]